MTTRLRRLFGSPTQNGNEGGRLSDFGTRDALAIFKPFNRTVEASESVGQLNTGSTNNELNTDQDNDTIRPGSNGEFSLMLSELTSLDRRSSFLTSYYGSSAIPSIANVQQSFAFAPSFQSRNPSQPIKDSLTGPVLPHFYPREISPSPVTSGSSLQNARRLPAIEEGKLSVSINFGTTFSGVAFGSSRITGGRVQQILQWPDSLEMKFQARKTPTCLLYDKHGEVLAWGWEALARFGLFLGPKFLRNGMVDPRLPQLPSSKLPFDVVVDFLSCLWNYAKQQIACEIGAVVDLSTADIWLIVPAAWNAWECDIMYMAAFQAGLAVRSGTEVRDGNHGRLNIIMEPEAATVHCAHLTNLHRLHPSQYFMICDAGNETVNLTIYQVLGNLGGLEIGEVCTRSATNCGGFLLKLRFRDLVVRLLEHHLAHTDLPSLANFVDHFSETMFRGEEDDHTQFQFGCFNVDDGQDDPVVGLVNGELRIPGALLRSEVFDPIISEVLRFVEEQLALCSHPVHALLLVGDFSENDYLFKSIDRRFSNRIGLIARPKDADTAACRGAARYGIANRTLVSNIIVPKTYIMEATVLAEQEDWQKRPAYINVSNKGVPLCKNRLQYLTRKGDILRKGQRVNATFCKLSQSLEDSMLTTVLYSSNSERIMRYTDEDATAELCAIRNWTVDLSVLPKFRENAKAGTQGGFCTEIEIGLEIDSAEVRGIVLYNGVEWGRVVFEYLNQ